jgi:hypothetical protein
MNVTDARHGAEMIVIAKLRDLVICKRFIIKEVAKELEISPLIRDLRVKLVSLSFVPQLLTVEQKHHLSVDSTLLEYAAAHGHFFKTLSLFSRIMNILKIERFEDVQTVILNATQLLEIRKTEYDRCFSSGRIAAITVSTQKDLTSKGISGTLFA